MRGIIVREELRSARILADEAAVDHALSQLSPAAANELCSSLGVSWCSLSSLRAFHETIAAVLKQDPTVWHMRVVEHATHQMFSTTWRFFLRLTSSDALIRRASTLYASILDTGKVEATILAPGHALVRLTDWPAPPAFHLDALASGIVTILRVAKIEQVRGRWQRTAEGADFEIRTAAHT